MERELTPREKSILRYIVEEFILTAMPVGSRHLVKKYRLNISPATVRNIMADLEELGYLWHPHTSAGRIPTDKGYRFYVNNFVETDTLSPDEKEVISRIIQSKSDLEEILKNTSKLIGKISKQLSITSTLQINNAVLKKLDLIELSETKLLVIITIQSGLVRTIVLEVANEIPKGKLEVVKMLLNERLVGLTLKQIRETFIERINDFRSKYEEIINIFISNASRLFYDFYDFTKIHIGGMPEVLTHPEFNKPERIKNIMELIEDEDTIIRILQMQSETDKVIVSIGEENPDDKLKDYTLIFSTYKIENITGSIGLIGPKRMNYSKMIALVDHTCKVLSQVVH